MENYDKLIQYAFRILAKKRYTCFELRKKLNEYLKRREITDDSVLTKVLSRLTELKYLDDRQYAVDYIRDRLKLKPRGEFLLIHELKRRGIPEDTIEDTLSSNPVDESGSATDALTRRKRRWETLPRQQAREKAFRFLSSRGFRPDAIYKAIDCCYSSSTE